MYLILRSRKIDDDELENEEDYEKATVVSRRTYVLRVKDLTHAREVSGVVCTSDSIGWPLSASVAAVESTSDCERTWLSWDCVASGKEGTSKSKLTGS